MPSTMLGTSSSGPIERLIYYWDPQVICLFLTSLILVIDLHKVAFKVGCHSLFFFCGCFSFCQYRVQCQYLKNASRPYPVYGKFLVKGNNLSKLIWYAFPFCIKKDGG